MVVPCKVGDKKPAVNWRRMKRIAAQKTLTAWGQQFPDANLGILTGPSNITIVDIDNMQMAERMLSLCGDTPLITETPRGGRHLWFKNTGEITEQDFEPGVDIRAIGGFALAPPSIKPETESKYQFIRGSLEDLKRLPPINPGSLPNRRDTSDLQPRKAPSGSVSAPISTANNNCVPETQRDSVIYPAMLLAAVDSQSPDDLFLKGMALSESLCKTPLTEVEIKAKAHKIWQYKEEGRLMPPGGKATFTYTENELDRLGGSADAALVFLTLKVTHRWRLGDEFILANTTAKKRFGWGINRFKKAIFFLRDRGFIEITHEGGNGDGDPRRARLL